jgi:hypothetical protein
MTLGLEFRFGARPSWSSCKCSHIGYISDWRTLLWLRRPCNRQAGAGTAEPRPRDAAENPDGRPDSHRCAGRRVRAEGEISQDTGGDESPVWQGSKALGGMSHDRRWCPPTIVGRRAVFDSASLSDYGCRTGRTLMRARSPVLLCLIAISTQHLVTRWEV